MPQIFELNDNLSHLTTKGLRKTPTYASLAQANRNTFLLSLQNCFAYIIWKLLEPSTNPRPLSHLKNVRCSCLPQDSLERHRNDSHEQSSLSQWPSDHKSMCILGIQILAIWTSEENPRRLAGQAKQSKLFKLFKLAGVKLDCIVNIRKASHVVGGFNPSQQNGKKLGKLPTADYYVFPLSFAFCF